jgi:hypothetical protein
MSMLLLRICQLQARGRLVVQNKEIMGFKACESLLRSSLLQIQVLLILLGFLEISFILDLSHKEILGIVHHLQMNIKRWRLMHVLVWPCVFYYSNQ